MPTESWNPWHGCRKCSLGCANCYVYYLDGVHGQDASIIRRSSTAFNAPVKRDRQKHYKIPAGTEVYTCFTSDFFLTEADEWRGEAWSFIRERADLTFLIPTKRIERFPDCLPSDWGEGYPNVTIAVSCENQRMADLRIPLLKAAPVRRKYVFACPLLSPLELDDHLADGQIDMVSVGGESYPNARECRFEWVEQIYASCRRNGVEFDFHQTGSNFVYEGRRFSIPHNEEYTQAKKAEKVLAAHYGNSR